MYISVRRGKRGSVRIRDSPPPPQPIMSLARDDGVCTLRCAVTSLYYYYYYFLCIRNMYYLRYYYIVYTPNRKNKKINKKLPTQNVINSAATFRNVALFQFGFTFVIPRQ